jgi:hypothetical protein
MLPLQHFRAVRICRLACEGDAMRDDDGDPPSRGFIPELSCDTSLARQIADAKISTSM